MQELWELICNGGDDSIIEALIYRLDGAIRTRCKFRGMVNEDLAQEVRGKLYKIIKDYQKNQ